MGTDEKPSEYNSLGQTPEEDNFLQDSFLNGNQNEEHVILNEFMPLKAT